MFTHEEMQQLKSLIDVKLENKLKPVNNKLDTIIHKINLLTQGAISTVTGVDTINDEQLQKK